MVDTIFCLSLSSCEIMQVWEDCIYRKGCLAPYMVESREPLAGLNRNHKDRTSSRHRRCSPER